MDELELRDKRQKERVSIEMITKIKTDSSHDEYIQGYREATNGGGDLKLLQPYEKPLSRTSPQKGIYFSPQDSLTLELKVFLQDSAKLIAGVAMTDRAHLYMVPRICCGFGDESSEIGKRFKNSISHLLDERFGGVLGSIKSTRDSIPFFEGLIKACE